MAEIPVTEPEIEAPAPAGKVGYQDGKTDPKKDDPVVREARKRTGAPEFQNAFTENPLVAILILIFGMLGMFTGKDLLGSGLGNFLKRDFGIDNADDIIRGAVGPGSLGDVPTGKRQEAVVATIPDAAEKIGIAPELMQGVWGIESRFGSHKSMVSSTGCSGDWQFSGSTFESMMQKHGKEIAEMAGDKLEPEVKQALESGNGNVRTEWGSDLRFHPVVSTYASAFYLKEVAGNLGVDPTKPENFGTVFAGYNVGPGNAEKLIALDQSGAGGSAVGHLGRVAAVNPMFFSGGASADESLRRYQAHIEARIADYEHNFAKEEPKPDLVADAGETAAKRTTSAAKGDAPPVIAGEFGASAAGKQPEKEPAPAVIPAAVPATENKPAPPQNI